MLQAFHKQQRENLTELEIIKDGRLMATITITDTTVDITYEQPVNHDCYDLLRIESNGNITIFEPTLA